MIGKTALPDSKYYDVFTSSNKSKDNYSVITAVNGSSSMNGVFKELLGTKTTQTTNWYGDSTGPVYSPAPWFSLGTHCDYGSLAGVFASVESESGVDNNSFRVVMVAK